MGTSKTANYINHIVLVLDASSSMGGLTDVVIKVVDNQIAHLAQRSKEMDQETRVTIYSFADTASCIIYDKDVLRLPSIREFYKPYGNTALIDATTLALNDLAMTPEKYGDHAFLVYVFTDGEENASGRTSSYNYGYRTSGNLVSELSSKINGLPANWTVACLVPNQNGVFEAKRFGFPAGNVAVWDATSAKGVTEVGERVKATTDMFMTNRASGIRGYNTSTGSSLFDIGANVVNAQAILDAGLHPLDYDDYDLVPIPPLKGLVKPADYDEKKRRKPWKAHGGRIDEFVQNIRGGVYVAGQAYYQLVEGKAEKIQPSKKIAVLNKKTDRVYTGAGARKLLGLPDNMEVRVKPSASDEYLVYVQSKSPNRLLVPGCRLLVFKK